MQVLPIPTLPWYHSNSFPRLQGNKTLRTTRTRKSTLWDAITDITPTNPTGKLLNNIFRLAAPGRLSVVGT